jgi:hypothetical protein
MLLHFLLSSILFPYIITGFVIALTMDVIIRYLKSSEPFDLSDIWLCIVFWPIVVFSVVRRLTKQSE